MKQRLTSFVICIETCEFYVATNSINLQVYGDNAARPTDAIM